MFALENSGTVKKIHDVLVKNNKLNLGIFLCFILSMKDIKLSATFPHYLINVKNKWKCIISIAEIKSNGFYHIIH